MILKPKLWICAPSWAQIYNFGLKSMSFVKCKKWGPILCAGCCFVPKLIIKLKKTFGEQNLYTARCEKQNRKSHRNSSKLHRNAWFSLKLRPFFKFVIMQFWIWINRLLCPPDEKEHEEGSDVETEDKEKSRGN